MLCAGGTASAAPILYGTTGTHLVTVDLDTLTMDVVGAHGVGGMTSLAYDPERDVFYGTTGMAHELWQIDGGSGAASLIGLCPYLFGLEFDPVSGELYGVGLMSELYIVNRDTAQGQFIGSAGRYFTYGLAIDAATRTFYSQSHGSDRELFTIDPDTGAGTTVGTVDIPGWGWIWLDSLVYDQQTSLLLGTETSGPQHNRLFQVDPSTMVTAVVGLLPQHMHGMAFAEFAPIPEPATLVLLGSGLVGIALRRRRGNRR